MRRPVHSVRKKQFEDLCEANRGNPSGNDGALTWVWGYVNGSEAMMGLLRRLNKTALTPLGRTPLERLVAKNID